MAHTPAPWLRESQINSEGSDWIIVTKDYEEIVDLRLGDGHVVSEDAQEANACLIAAAPDLLAALKKHLPWQRNGEPDRPPQGWGIWQDAVDAIAKAEGVTMEGTNGKERSLD
jgi:hypothetical protein